MKRKKYLLLLMLMVFLLILSSCNSIQEIDVSSKPKETTVAIIPLQVIEETTPTPVPTVIIREPVKNHSPMRIMTDVEEGVEIPYYYQPLDIPGVNHCVYAFQDKNNETQFRVYAEVDELEDENIVNTLKGFFTAKIYTDESGEIIVETDKSEDPIDTDTEEPAEYIPCPVPTAKAIKSYIKESEAAKKKYNKQVEEAEKNGDPIPEPTTWNGLPVLTEETESVSIPSFIKAVKKKNYLYYYVNVYGENEYRQFATCDGKDSGFYLSTEEGGVARGALKIDINLDFAKENVKRGKALERINNEPIRLPVLVTTTDGNTITVYTIH